jgi:hypothetical protein
LCRQKKVTQEKATPVCRRCAVPCVARLVRRLRNSRYALRQSSPKSPDQPALLGGAQGKMIKTKKQQGMVSCAHHALKSNAMLIRFISFYFQGEKSRIQKPLTLGQHSRNQWFSFTV